MEHALDSDLKLRLAQHRALGAAPEIEHAWLIAHGEPRSYGLGDVVTKKGEAAKSLLVVFSGHLVIRADRGAGSQKVFEWHGGDVGGVMPYSRGASPPNDVVAEEPTEVLAVAKELLGEMARECPTITATLVHLMVDRARQFTSSELRDEKLISLGKLAAGMAHELNNPASAVVRSAKLLADGLRDAEHAARRLSAAGLSDAQFSSIEGVRATCTITPDPANFSALDRADREDALVQWLIDHDADTASAGPLADAGLTVPALDSLHETVGTPALDATLRWIAANCLVRALSTEIERAAGRIHELVGAVKGFSYMDHAPKPEPVDIRRGITDTLAVLASKTREKKVHVTTDVPEDLPRVHAVGAELNQVWMNLIDNALDAVRAGGHVTVSATRELNVVVVRVVDNGPGIPDDIRGRIFDPFFTTKGVGKGTGLGLDIVRRLVQQHEGGLALESEPGRTEFQVRLKVES